MSDADVQEEMNAIRSAIAAYEDAVHTASPESFRLAFHPDALLARPMVPGGPLVVSSLAEYSENAERLYSGEVDVVETTRGITIDVAGHVAVARLDFAVVVGNESFEGTDFLNLVKLGGRWVVTYVLWDLSTTVNTS